MSASEKALIAVVGTLLAHAHAQPSRLRKQRAKHLVKPGEADRTVKSRTGGPAPCTT